MTSEELVAAGILPNKKKFTTLGVVKTVKFGLETSLVVKRILQISMLILMNLSLLRVQNLIPRLSCLVNQRLRQISSRNMRQPVSFPLAMHVPLLMSKSLLPKPMKLLYFGTSLHVGLGSPAILFSAFYFGEVFCEDSSAIT
jgi:hypothetical protein